MCPSIESDVPCPSSSPESCPYAHSASELRATPMLYRTVICSWWKKGQCEFGDTCRFAHGEDQLQISCESSCQGSPKNSLITGATTTGTPSSFSSLSNNYTTNNSPAIAVAGAASAVSSPMYPSVLAAALTAASRAAVNGGLTLLTAEQSMAIASAASAAAIEAINRQQTAVQPPSQVLEAEINRQLRKGFASSPALLSFFEESSSPPSSSSLVLRPRADSDPIAKSQNILQELERLWINNAEEDSSSVVGTVVGSPALSVVGVPLMRSDPFLSASHMTLNDYQINID
jgi:hypothetical protein